MCSYNIIAPLKLVPMDCVYTLLLSIWKPSRLEFVFLWHPGMIVVHSFAIFGRNYRAPDVYWYSSCIRAIAYCGKMDCSLAFSCLGFLLLHKELADL